MRCGEDRWSIDFAVGASIELGFEVDEDGGDYRGKQADLRPGLAANGLTKVVGGAHNYEDEIQVPIEILIELLLLALFLVPAISRS